MDFQNESQELCCPIEYLLATNGYLNLKFVFSVALATF